MIRLEVEPYCHNCPGFEADVKRPEKLYYETGFVEMTDTVVHCAFRKRCSVMMQYLEKQKEQDKV